MTEVTSGQNYDVECASESNIQVDSGGNLYVLSGGKNRQDWGD